MDDSLVSMPSVDDNSDFAIDLEHLSADEQTQEEEDVSDQSTLGVLDRESQGNVREEKSSEISGESISSEPSDKALNRQAQIFRPRSQTISDNPNLAINKTEETSSQVGEIDSSKPQFEDVVTSRVAGTVGEGEQSQSKNFKKQSPFVTVSDKRTQK